jgi:type IV pilus assembly protein PilE
MRNILRTSSAPGGGPERVPAAGQPLSRLTSRGRQRKPEGCPPAALSARGGGGGLAGSRARRVGRGVRGFTLIELMIVVAVVAILAAIAYPSYLDSVRKSRRSDARNALHAAASREEQYYEDNKTYTASMTDLKYSTDPADSPEAYYKVSVVDTTDCPLASISTCFGLLADPQGDQQKDTHCGKMYLYSTGLKKANTADCW